MPEPWPPSEVPFLRAGELVLPSGRWVWVGQPDETWVPIELSDGMVAIVDLDELAAGKVELFLYWPPDPVRFPSSVTAPGCMPDGYEATVRVEGSVPRIELSTTGPHTADCDCGVEACESQFRVWAPPERVLGYLDVLTGMARSRSVQRVGIEGEPDGVEVWRGRLDAGGTAVTEWVTFREPLRPGGVHDARGDDRAFSTRGTLSFPELAARPDGGAVTTTVEQTVGPGLPGAVPVGRETMSAAGGGGGSVECVATTADLAEAVELLSRDRGEPEERTATTATWRRASGSAVSFVELWVVGHGSAPGFRPEMVPPSARCVAAFGHVAVPTSPAETEQPVARRWWHRRRGR